MDKMDWCESYEFHWRDERERCDRDHLDCTRRWGTGVGSVHRPSHEMRCCCEWLFEATKQNKTKQPTAKQLETNSTTLTSWIHTNFNSTATQTTNRHDEFPSWPYMCLECSCQYSGMTPIQTASRAALICSVVIRFNSMVSSLSVAIMNSYSASVRRTRIGAISS